MATQVQYRRGTGPQNDAFTGALGEITVDTTNWTLRIADGATPGGFSLVGLASTQTLLNKTYQGTSVSVTGNVIGGNINTAGLITATANITGGNIRTGGIVSATGNIIGSYIFGNGSQLTGIDTTSIQNGTSNVRVVTSGGNVAIGIGGISNVVLVTSTGVAISGSASATGNIIGGNILTGGLISSTGDITSGNILTGGLISSTGDITGGNILTGGLISSTGDITGGNILTGGLISATGNASFANTTITGNLGAATIRGVTLVTADGTYSSVNNPGVMLQVTGQAANPARVYIDGVGANNYAAVIGRHYRGTSASPTAMLANDIISRFGAVPYTTAGWPSISTTRIDMVADENQTLGGTGSRIELWVTPNNSNTIAKIANVNTTGLSVTGILSTTGNITGGNLVTAGVITATGNVFGGNLVTVGLISAGSDITGSNLSVGTGTITGGNILNSNGNGVGNIGNASIYFNTVFAKATSAQYADVAEKYVADADYPTGTVLIFGGSAEVTQSNLSHDTAIAGTVSDSPAYVMNAGLDAPNVATVALLGRVPCRVSGSIRKGDLLVSSHVPGVATALDKTQYSPGCVIGKALENYNSTTEGIIEIAVGRL